MKERIKKAFNKLINHYSYNTVPKEAREIAQEVKEEVGKILDGEPSTAKDSKMTEMTRHTHSLEVSLKTTSLGVINIPTEIMEAIGWNINEAVEVYISDCSNMEGEEWQEIKVARKIDMDRIYQDE